jgi:hypothetical protein
MLLREGKGGVVEIMASPTFLLRKEGMLPIP